MSEYELPEGWGWARLEDLAAPEPNSMTDGPFGSKLKSEHYVEDGAVRVIRLGNVGVGQFLDAVRAYVPAERLDDLAKHRAFAGDLVVAALADPVGRACQLPDRLGPAVVKADCVRFKVADGLSARFVMHWLNSPQGLAQAKETAHGVGRVRINMGEMRQLRVPQPQPGEQHQIAARIDDFLGRAGQVREALADVPALLDQLRQSVLAAAFRGDLTAEWREAHPEAEPAAVLLGRIRAERRRRFEEANPRKQYVPPAPVDPEAEGPPELPAGWEWATLEELTDSLRLIQYGILKPGPDLADGVPYVKVRNMKEEIIDVAGLCRTSPEVHAQYRRSTLARGDLLMSIRGSYGAVALVPDKLHGANITQDSARIAPLPGVDRHFLRSMLRSPACQAYFAEVATGMAVRGLNIGDLRPARVPLAPVAEQAEVARRVEADLATLRGVQTEVGEILKDVESLERATLSRAFRGELA